MTTMKGITTMVVFSSDQSKDLFETTADESQTPIAVITSSFKGKIQILITRKSENLVDDKVH